MSTSFRYRPTNSGFKTKTGLDVEYIRGLTDDEVIQLLNFLTQTTAGQKFALNASQKNKRLQVNNRRLGQEKQEVVDYADQTINIIKNESDQKLINIAEAVKALLNKPINRIKKQDIKDILTLIQQSLWS